MANGPNGNQYCIEHTRSFVWFGNHYDKICWMLVLVGTGYSYSIMTRDGWWSVWGVFCFLSLMPLLFVFLIQRFAWRIAIDYDLRTVAFDLFRNKGRLIYDFESIRTIMVNMYLVFKVPNRNICYRIDLKFNERLTEQLIHLNKISKIRWGFLCGMFGPSKALRDELDRAWVDRGDILNKRDKKGTSIKL